MMTLGGFPFVMLGRHMYKQPHPRAINVETRDTGGMLHGSIRERGEAIKPMGRGGLDHRVRLFLCEGLKLNARILRPHQYDMQHSTPSPFRDKAEFKRGNKITSSWIFMFLESITKSSRSRSRKKCHVSKQDNGRIVMMVWSDMERWLDNGNNRAGKAKDRNMFAGKLV